MSIDYKALLVKYINHVCTEEGTTFISEWMEGFTDEEKEYLLSIRGPIYETKEPLVRNGEYSEAMKKILLESLNVK